MEHFPGISGTFGRFDRETTQTVVRRRVPSLPAPKGRVYQISGAKPQGLIPVVVHPRAAPSGAALSNNWDEVPALIRIRSSVSSSVRTPQIHLSLSANQTVIVPGSYQTFTTMGYTPLHPGRGGSIKSTGAQPQSISS